MKLSDFFELSNIINDATFDDLSYSSGYGMNTLTFCDTVIYLKVALSNENISSIIINKELLKYIGDTNKGIVICKKPRDSFFDIYTYMRDNNLFKYNMNYGVDKTSIISKSAIISKNCYIGKNSVINENVIIKDNVFIGDNCFIDSGAILGNDGILYKEENGNNIFIKHAGVVKINNNVTILSNSVIVKSVFPNMPTVIGDYSIIGIATTIGHEARVGKNCRVLGNCVVAKNVNIEDNTIIGSSSVIKENIFIGKNADIKAGSIVVKDVKNEEVVSGNFALNHNLNIKNYLKSLNR